MVPSSLEGGVSDIVLSLVIVVRRLHTASVEIAQNPVIVVIDLNTRAHKHRCDSFGPCVNIVLFACALSPAN